MDNIFKDGADENEELSSEEEVAMFWAAGRPLTPEEWRDINERLKAI